jgi:hypothetical protein
MLPACFELIHNSRFDRADTLLGTQIRSPHLLQMQRDEPARKYGNSAELGYVTA